MEEEAVELPEWSHEDWRETLERAGKEPGRRAEDVDSLVRGLSGKHTATPRLQLDEDEDDDVDGGDRNGLPLGSEKSLSLFLSVSSLVVVFTLSCLFFSLLPSLLLLSRLSLSSLSFSPSSTRLPFSFLFRF